MRTAGQRFCGGVQTESEQRPSAEAVFFREWHAGEPRDAHAVNYQNPRLAGKVQRIDHHAARQRNALINRLDALSNRVQYDGIVYETDLPQYEYSSH